MLDDFFSSIPSLKICGVTTLGDAKRLAELKVAALGLNFWPSSKRYCSPENASTIASHVAGDILRVGVSDVQLTLKCVQLICVQLVSHGSHLA